MLRRKQELLPKFTAYYRQLRALPRRTRRLLQRKFAPSLAGVALCLTASGYQPGWADTITVDGTCTLVDAITTVNSDSNTGNCVQTGPSSAADTIVLTVDTTLLVSNPGGYYGPTGLPVVSSVVTISGHGHVIARDSGAPSFRLLAVGSSGDLTLQDTTVSGGTALVGGGSSTTLGSSGWRGARSVATRRAIRAEGCSSPLSAAAR